MQWRDKTSQKSKTIGLLIISIFVLISGGVSADNPWVQSFNPVRQLYVSPNGTGNGTSDNPMNFTAAINSAVPGDLYWMKAGTYTGAFTISRSGNASNPIVFRAMQGAQVIVVGGIKVTGAHNWIWGFEVKDPNGVANIGGIQLHAAGIHAINNTVHDIYSNIGIGAWSQGAGQVVYGNIVYKQLPNGINPHNIYTQNDYATYGYKYIVGNMLLDSWDANDDTYNFHAYTEGALITGFHLENNIMKRGRVLIGGYGDPAQNEVVKKNYFYEAPMILGWRRPTQVRFENNYLGKSFLDTQYYWGAGEEVYPPPLPNVYSGNEIYNSAGPHIVFRSSAYINGNRCDGCPEIRSADVFDNNKYSSPFSATFYADNNNAGTVTFSAWKTNAANAGNPVDTNSTVLTSVANKIAVIPNEYESGRGHIAIFNWSHAATISGVDLSSVLAGGANFTITNPRTGATVLTGVYSGPVNIPAGGVEFMALLLTSTGASEPPPPDSTPPVLSNISISSVGTTSGTITWDSDEAADTQVEYGTTVCPCGTNTPLNPNLTTAHNVALSGLQTNTLYHYRVKSKDAAGNLSISSDRTFTTGSTPPPTGPVYIYQEAEGSSLSGTMKSIPNTLSSGRRYIASNTQDQGVGTFNVAIPSTGNYIVWARVIADSPGTDSFHVSADNGAEDVYDLTSGNWSTSWVWSRVAGRGTTGTARSIDPLLFNLSEGSHTIRFRGREPNAKLDMVLVTNDLSFVPNDSVVSPDLYKVLPKKVTNSTAKIKWKTTGLANSMVEWGTNSNYGSVTPVDLAMVEKHSMKLENLQPGTTYHFRVRSVDASGKNMTSADYSFTTLAQ